MGETSICKETNGDGHVHEIDNGLRDDAGSDETVLRMRPDESEWDRWTRASMGATVTCEGQPRAKQREEG